MDNQNIYSDIASVSAGLGTQLGLGAASLGYAIKGVLNSRELPTKLDRLIDIGNYRSLRALRPDTHRKVELAMLGMKNPMHHPLYNVINKGFGNKKPGILAHELGHKAYHDFLVKKLGNPIGKAVNIAPRVAGKAGILAGSSIPFFTNNREVARDSALAGTGLSSLVLADEALASGIGSRIINRINKSLPSTTKKISRISPWVGVPTYLLAAASPYLTYKAIDLAGGYKNPKVNQN